MSDVMLCTPKLVPLILEHQFLKKRTKVLIFLKCIILDTLLKYISQKFAQGPKVWYNGPMNKQKGNTMSFNYSTTSLYLSKVRAKLGVKPPAVTQIITKTNVSFDKFMEKIEAGFDFETEQAKFVSFMNKSSAVRRGRKVAHALEGGTQTQDENVNRVLHEMHRVMRGFEVVQKEAPLHFKDIYWGKADLVGLHKGALVIADNKSVTKQLQRGKDGEVLESKYKGYGMQVAAYAHAHNKMFGTKIDKGVLFFAEGDGSSTMSSTIIEVDIKEYLPMFFERVQDYYLREYILGKRETMHRFSFK